MYTPLRFGNGRLYNDVIPSSRFITVRENARMRGAGEAPLRLVLPRDSRQGRRIIPQVSSRGMRGREGIFVISIHYVDSLSASERAVLAPYEISLTRCNAVLG